MPFSTDSIYLVYVMRGSCLKDQAKVLVENIDDMDTIWKHLDDKYGDKIDLVDVVIKDLESLPSMEVYDDVKFIQMVDTLEKGLYI